MKRIVVCILISILLLYCYGGKVKDKFLKGNFESNIRIPLKKLKSNEDKFYAGLSYFNYDSIYGWERGFYLVRSSKYSQSDFLNNIKKYIPKMLNDEKKLSYFIINAFYNQMYDVVRNLFTKEYYDLVYLGNRDQWWDQCEKVRHFLKGNSLHPRYLYLEKNDNCIKAKEKPFSLAVKNEKIDGIYYKKDDLFYVIALNENFFLGNIAKKYTKFEKRRIELDQKDIDSGYKFAIYFGKIKAGYMYEFLRDAGDYYELFVTIKTSKFFDKIYKIRDYNYFKLRKDDLAVIYSKENIKEGHYKTHRWAQYYPEDFYGIYKGKEKMSLPIYAQDTYSILYLIKAQLPNCIERANFISVRRTYPFKLNYSKKTFKIKGETIKGIAVQPEYLGQKPIRKGYDGEFFFDGETFEPVYSKTKTEYGDLTAYVIKKINEKKWLEEGNNYENFRN